MDIVYMAYMAVIFELDDNAYEKAKKSWKAN